MRPERCRRQRTGREDRRSKFYEVSDNLRNWAGFTTLFGRAKHGRWTHSQPIRRDRGSGSTEGARCRGGVCSDKETGQAKVRVCQAPATCPRPCIAPADPTEASGKTSMGQAIANGYVVRRCFVLFRAMVWRNFAQLVPSVLSRPRIELFWTELGGVV